MHCIISGSIIIGIKKGLTLTQQADAQNASVFIYMATARSKALKGNYFGEFKTKAEHDKALSKHYLKNASKSSSGGIVVHEKGKKSYKV